MKNLLLCAVCFILCCSLSACGADVVSDMDAGEDALKNRLIYGPDFDPNADNSAYTINGEASTNPQDSNEPGSDRPVTIYYGGHVYSHDGYITYDLPDGFDFIGETNNVGNSSKTENFAANEDGYLYKSIENDELIYFQWKEWDESVDGGEEPYLLLYCKEQYDDPINPVAEQNYHIVNIVDRTKTEGLPYDTAEEKFFEDCDNEYYFSGIYSHYVIVHYEDGSQEDIVTALNAGRATIADLDMFEVDYIVRALDTENVKP